MALMKSSEIPKDAVILDEAEAINYVWKTVEEWDSWKDVWALKHGSTCLGAISAVSGMMINRHYRWRFRLGNYGYIASIVPVSIMSGLLSTFFHKSFVTTDILLMKNDKCPICYEVKSSALQMGIGVSYPMVLAPTSALMFANRYSTYRIPNLFEGPKVMLNFLSKHTKPFSGTLTLIVVLQLVASAFVTYFEMRNAITFRHKMLEGEDQEEL